MGQGERATGKWGEEGPLLDAEPLLDGVAGWSVRLDGPEMDPAERLTPDEARALGERLFAAAAKADLRRAAEAALPLEDRVLLRFSRFGCHIDEAIAGMLGEPIDAVRVAIGRLLERGELVRHRVPDAFQLPEGWHAGGAVQQRVAAIFERMAAADARLENIRAGIAAMQGGGAARGAPSPEDHTLAAALREVPAEERPRGGAGGGLSKTSPFSASAVPVAPSPPPEAVRDLERAEAALSRGGDPERAEVAVGLARLRGWLGSYHTMREMEARARLHAPAAPLAAFVTRWRNRAREIWGSPDEPLPGNEGGIRQRGRCDGLREAAAELEKALASEGPPRRGTFFEPLALPVVPVPTEEVAPQRYAVAVPNLPTGYATLGVTLIPENLPRTPGRDPGHLALHAFRRWAATQWPMYTNAHDRALCAPTNLIRGSRRAFRAGWRACARHLARATTLPDATQLAEDMRRMAEREITRVD